MITPAQLVAGNDIHAASFAMGDLASRPKRGLAIVACMDARLEPLAAFKLEVGDAHVIRNAGGRVDEGVIRSLVVSTLALATRVVAVVHHTDCGMAKLGNADLRALVESVGASTTEDFLTTGDADEALWLDMATISTSPLLPPDITVVGFRYDVHSGRMTRVG